MLVVYTSIETATPTVDFKKAQVLYNRLKIEDLILRGVAPKQLSMADKYKEYIRDADRISNEESLEKYGTTIDELRNRVSDFVDDLESGNANEPNIPKPQRN